MNEPVPTAPELPIQKSRLAEVCASEIDALQSSTPGVLSATATTTDGFTLASTLDSRVDADKISAMASSMGALGAALSRSTGRGGVDNLSIESAEGKIVLMRVAGLREPVVIAAIADEKVNLGQLLWACRKACRQISQAAKSTG